MVKKKEKVRTRDTQISNKNLAKILKKINKQIPKMVKKYC